MTAGTYEIKNKLDGMAYGGSSGEIERRWKHHLWMLRNDRHHCIRLQRAWNKYGEDVFEFRVLEVIEGADERLTAEQVWLDIHHANKTCYNSAITAGPKGPISEETRRRLSASQMGNQYALGCAHSEEANRAQSESQMGFKHTEEFGQAVSERMTGKQYALGSTHTEEWKRAASERLMGNERALGSKRTKEQNRAQSERMMGRPVSDATRQKIADANGRPYPAFIHRDTGEIIPAGLNLRRMCRERGFTESCMRAVKNSKQSHHKGWVLLVEKKESD